MGLNFLIQNISVKVIDKNKDKKKAMKEMEDSRLEILRDIFAIWNAIFTHINKKHTKVNQQ